MSNPQDQLLKENVLKDVFSWEIPVDNVPVPSKGKIYDPNSKLYNKETIAIKAMTAKEENILASTSLLKDGIIIDELIKSCIVDKSIDIEDLIIGDKNALMVSIRITGYGSNYDVTTTCKFCQHANEIGVDLSSLEIKPLSIEPVREGANLFKYVLPVTKKEVLFKYLTGRETNEIGKLEEFESKNFNTKVTKTITNFLWYSIVSVDSITDKNKIKKFVENMPAYDSKSLRTFIEKHEPNVVMEHQYDCKKCGETNKSNLPMTINFFWPAF